MCNLKNLVAAWVLLLATCLPISAFAYDETLTFRLNAQGEVEAVIDGRTHRGGCDEISRFTPPMSTTIDGNTVLIQSPALAPCSIPLLPTEPYQVVANLGHLSGETYQVTWNVEVVGSGFPPIRSISATFSVSSLFSVAAPALSPWAMCLLLLSTAGVAFAALRRRNGRLSR